MVTYDLKAADLVSSTWAKIADAEPRVWCLLEVKNEAGDIRQGMRTEKNCFLIGDENNNCNLLTMLATLARKQTQGSFVVKEWRYL